MQSQTSLTRPPAVAGLFYPADAAELARMVSGLLAATPGHTGHRPPKAIIAPHAGYIYSGPTAARAYALLQPHALLQPFRGRVRQVVLLGPTSAAELEMYDRGERIVAPIGCVNCYLTDCDVDPDCMQLIEPGVVLAAVQRWLK